MAIKKTRFWVTKRGWVTLMIAVTSFFIAMVNISLAACVVSALLCAIFLGSLLMGIFSLKGIDVVRLPTQDGILGQAMLLPVRVTNKLKRFRQTCVLIEEAPFAENGIIYTPVFALAPYEERLIKRQITAERRGGFHLDTLVIRGGDPAGLFYWQRRFSFPMDLTIFPMQVTLPVVPLQLRHRIVASMTGQSIGVSGLGQEFFGVRPYRPTDGIRFVHWKASARQRQLMVREFEENTIHQISILLDNDINQMTNEGRKSNFEMLVTCASSLVNYLSGVYCRVLFATGRKGASIVHAGQGPSVREDIRHSLALLGTCKVHALEVFEEVIDRIPANSVVYVLSMTPPKDLEAALGLLIRQRCDVRLMLAPGDQFKEYSWPMRRPNMKAPPAIHGIVPDMLAPDAPLADIFAQG